MRPWFLSASCAALALAACASAPRTAPVDAAALYGDVLAARLADQTNDPAGASDRAMQALALAPQDALLAERALDAALHAGQPERAFEAAAVLAAADGTHPAAHMTLGVERLAARRYGAASQMFARVQGPPLDRLITAGLDAWALAAQGREDEAIARLDRERGAIGRLLDLQRGMILDRAGRSEDALRAYDSAERSGLRLTALTVLKAEAQRRLGDQVAALETIADARRRSEAPDLAAAAAALQAGRPALEATPQQAAALGVFSMAMVLIGEGVDAEMAPYLTLALALDPGFDLARIALSESMEGEAAAPLALSQLAQIGPDSPYRETAAVQMAWKLYDLGREEEAFAAARAAAAVGGRFARQAEADLLRATGDFAAAEAAYTALISGAGAAPHRGDWRLYFSRGVARERLGRWTEAEADLMRALELEPDNADALNYLGYSWIERGERLEEALAMIERAVRLRPDSGAIIDSLGWAHFKLGDFEKALPLLERAAELSPSDPAINDHLGDAYWQAGRRLEARFQWRKAIEAAGEDPGLRARAEAKLAGGLPKAPNDDRADGGAP